MLRNVILSQVYSTKVTGCLAYDTEYKDIFFYWNDFYKPCDCDTD